MTRMKSLVNLNRVAIAGVINLSEESFYKGSIFHSENSIIRKAKELVSEGADIIDIGAASTAPGTPYIPLKEEVRRLKDVLKPLRKAVDVPLSIDTQRSAVAEMALAAEFDVVNDVSGLKSDERIADVVSQYGAMLVVMACNKKPGDAYTISQALHYLSKSIEIAKRYGVKEQDIIVDPGIGFGKPISADLSLINNLDYLKRSLKKPILVGVSRKRFIGEILGVSVEDRLYGSIGATIIAVARGANFIRTHDVKPTLQAIRVAEAILSSKRCIS